MVIEAIVSPAINSNSLTSPLSHVTSGLLTLLRCGAEANLVGFLLAQFGLQALDGSFVFVGLSHDAVQRVAGNSDAETCRIDVLEDDLLLFLVPVGSLDRVGACREVGDILIEVFFGDNFLAVFVGVESVLIEINMSCRAENS